MSFKARYLGEATGQTITDEMNKANDFVTGANAGAVQAPTGTPPPPPTVQAAPALSASTLIKSSEATDDLNRSSVGNPKPNPTPNDASQKARAVDTEQIRANKDSSRTPGNVNLAESITFNGVDIDARIRGPFANNLTQKLKDVGLNTGMSTFDLSPAVSASKNITTGEKSKFGLDRSHAKREAKDGLKTGQNVPGREDVKNTMMLSDSTYFKIISLVEEYTNQDVENASKGPVKHTSVPKGQGVQPGTHTAQAMAQTKTMNDITEDKMQKNAQLRKMTAPEVDKDYAAEHTSGIKSNQYAQKYSTDAMNAQTRAQKEERKSTEAQQSQEQ